MSKATSDPAPPRRGIHKLLAVATFIALSVLPASALERNTQRNIFVSAGREARIASYGAPDDKCKAIVQPDVAIAEWPSYGSIADKPVRVIAERSNVLRADHPCLGKFIDALAIYYRPKPGFRGSDRVRLRIRFDPAAPASSANTVEEEILIGVR